MNTLDAIEARRSIRKFRSDPILREVLQSVLRAATQAPSGKNRQPWRFHVVQGDAREQMMHLMREGIARTKERA